MAKATKVQAKKWTKAVQKVRRDRDKADGALSEFREMALKIGRKKGKAAKERKLRKKMDQAMRARVRVSGGTEKKHCRRETLEEYQGVHQNGPENQQNPTRGTEEGWKQNQIE